MNIFENSISQEAFAHNKDPPWMAKQIKAILKNKFLKNISRRTSMQISQKSWMPYKPVY